MVKQRQDCKESWSLTDSLQRNFAGTEVQCTVLLYRAYQAPKGERRALTRAARVGERYEVD